MRQARPLPSASRLVAIARQDGAPGLDRVTIDAILSGQDPTVAAETEAVLATVEALVRQRQRPATGHAISPPISRAPVRDAVTGSQPRFGMD
jgi:hypothetical protein